MSSTEFREQVNSLAWNLKHGKSTTVLETVDAIVKLHKAEVDSEVVRVLNHWADFFEDPSMNSMTPSERLRKAAEQRAAITPKGKDQ